MRKALVELRSAVAGDVHAMHAIEVECFGDPWSVESFRSSLAHPRVRARVAARGGTLIGYSIAVIVDEEAELSNLAVTPRERRTGVGALLLDDLLDAVAAGGDGSVWLEVRDGNVAARGLYASRGFVESGRRKGYYRGPVEDAVVMRRPPRTKADPAR